MRFVMVYTFLIFVGVPFFFSFVVACTLEVIISERNDKKKMLANKAPLDANSKEYLIRYMPKSS